MQKNIFDGISAVFLFYRYRTNVRVLFIFLAQPQEEYGKIKRRQQFLRIANEWCQKKNMTK
jgi:hypothetical protein